MPRNDSSIAHSFIWKLFERGSSQLITLVVQIVLARILVPDEFGEISILLVFINIANVFIQKGFASSLIRKENVVDDDYNTAFIVSELIAFACFLVLFTISGALESFYKIENFGLFMKVLSVSLLFGALYSVQNAELVRKMKFKQVFYRSLAASVGSGAIGIFTAILHFGAWALVLQILSQQIIVCIATSVACDWKPRIRFSKISFNELFSFGSKILVAEIISIGAENLRTLIIGKNNASDLAYYDRGQVYPATAMRSIYDTISSVLLPVFSKIQAKEDKLADSVKVSLEVSLFLVSPLFFLLASIARPLVLVLLTEKWEAAIPYLIIFCIYQIAFPAYGIFRQCMYALGRSEEVLKIEITRSVIFILAIIIGVFVSPLCIAVLSCVVMYITTVLYYYALDRYIALNGVVIIKNIAVTLGQCFLMASSIQLVNRVPMPNSLLILLDSMVGVLIYILLSVVFKNKSFSFCYRYLLDRQK